MRSLPSLRAIATLPLFALLAGCGHIAVTGGVPNCQRLIPPSLLAAVPSAPLPEARQLPDGHDDAQPWQVGFIEQTGQLEKANERAPAVDHIYRNCLELHREALRRDTRRSFLGIF
jgi:hypothetical protein